MTVYTLLGRQRLEFRNNVGETIKGINLFVAYEDPSVEGFKTDKFFVKPEIKLPELKMKDSIVIYFNSKGKVEGVTKA